MFDLIENKARADIELDIGSEISAIPLKTFRRILPIYKIFPSDVQLKTAIGEIFKPVRYVAMNVTYENKTKNVYLYNLIQMMLLMNLNLFKI